MVKFSICLPSNDRKCVKDICSRFLNFPEKRFEAEKKFRFFSRRMKGENLLTRKKERKITRKIKSVNKHALGAFVVKV